MKAKTAAQKLKAKRGRPALPSSNIEPNGRKSRRVSSVNKRTLMSEAEARSVVVQKRIRDNNIVAFRQKDGKTVTAEERAADPRFGYVLGLMLMDGTINRRQHEAGVNYAQDMARYYGLTGVQFPSARAQDLFRVGGGDGEDSTSKADRAVAARSRMVKLRDLLLKVGDINTGRHVVHTVNCIALQDIPESRCWPPHMIAWLKRGLNKLADFYVIEPD